MTISDNLRALIEQFNAAYDANAMDQTWKGLSERFHRFWNERIMSSAPGPIPDAECDEIIRILDRNGKGNTRNSEAVARAMVPQGAWRRMFNEKNGVRVGFLSKLIQSGFLRMAASFADPTDR